MKLQNCEQNFPHGKTQTLLRYFLEILTIRKKIKIRPNMLERLFLS